MPRRMIINPTHDCTGRTSACLLWPGWRGSRRRYR